MYKRLNELNFVIGLFFALTSLILFADYFLDKRTTGQLNLYTGIAFLIFGIFMILINRKVEDSGN